MGVASKLSTYFLYRNKLLFVKRNAIDINACDICSIITGYIRTLLSYLVKRRNLEAVKGLVAGVYDFCIGRFGPGRYGEA